MIIGNVLQGISLTITISSFLIAFPTLILICVCVRPLMSNVPILLTCNTHLNVMIILVIVYSLLDTRDPSVSFNDFSCGVRSYINHVFICAFFYSCALHAIFRFFRVIFPKHKILQTRAVFIVAISIQWLVTILYIAVYVSLGNFQYHGQIGSCWFSF